jgi:hypothetical protein
MSARWLAMLPAAAAILAQTAPQPASISGTVTNSVTSEPILRAHVSVHCFSEHSPQNEQAYGALTNAKGEFSIPGLPPANCSLTAERVGFVAPLRGESYPLANAAHKEDLKLTLIPAGAITGRVLDAAGEPAQGIEVSAELANGNSSEAATDDKGQFRIGGLRPGKYHVKAARRSSMPFPPEIRSDGSQELRDAATYYPGSLSAKTAQRLEVKAGAEVSGVDIKLVQTPVVQVSGKVTGLPPGMKNVIVQTFSGQGAGVKPDGTFSIWRLDPGKYTLQAQQWSGQSSVMSAPIGIEVGTANLEHLELRMVPPFEVAGQLRFDDEHAREPAKPPTRPDGTSPPVPPQPPRRVDLRPFNRQNGQQAGASVGSDDSFTLEKVQPGRYRVVINWGSAYVKSVRAGDTETEGAMVDLRNGSPGPLTVSVSSNFCEISGTVSDTKGRVAGATLVLEDVEDPRDIQLRQTDSTGTYKFRVPPGSYKLAVIDEEAMFSGFEGPDLEDYEPESLELNAGDKVTKDLVRRQ